MLQCDLDTWKGKNKGFKIPSLPVFFSIHAVIYGKEIAPCWTETTESKGKNYRDRLVIVRLYVVE